MRCSRRVGERTSKFRRGSLSAICKLLKGLSHFHHHIVLLKSLLNTDMLLSVVIVFCHLLWAPRLSGAKMKASGATEETETVAESNNLKRRTRSPSSNCPASACLCTGTNPSLMSCQASNNQILIENVDIDNVVATNDGSDNCRHEPYDIYIRNSGIKTLAEIGNITNCDTADLFFIDNPELVVKAVSTSNVLSLRCLVLKGSALKDFEDHSVDLEVLDIANLTTSMSSFSAFETTKLQATKFSKLEVLGELDDFFDFRGFAQLETVIIKNVNSRKGTSLLPDAFLSRDKALEYVAIKSSFDVILPKSFLSYLGIPSNRLNLTIDIWNVQQTSLDVNSIEVLKTLNGMKMQQTSLYNAFKDNGKCSVLCRKNNQQVKCSSLSNTEKRNCGICVKNKISINKLDDEQERQCSLTDHQSIYGYPDRSPATTAAHPEWMTTWVDYIEGVNLGNDYDLIPYNCCSRMFPMLQLVVALIIEFF